MDLQQLVDKITQLEQKVKELEEAGFDLAEVVEFLLDRMQEYEDMAIQELVREDKWDEKSNN